MPIPAWVATAAPLVGDVIGGLFGRSGQNSANEANLQIARENREWQERMSSTAYQRAAKDLEAAGLNRILALGGPSSTPAGNTATMLNKEAPLQEGISKGVSTALQAKMMRAQIANIEADTASKTPKVLIGKGLQGIADTVGPVINPSDPLGNARKWNEVFSTTAKMAKDNIQRVAESVGLGNQPGREEKLLLKILDEMDLGKMTVTEKLQWAAENPEKIQEYMKRRNIRGQN
uniref:hypothetical protein n=1 Tax=Shewanella sp. TaxID=50422 RepID=UPI004047ACDF